jgi:hypothetical protein
MPNGSPYENTDRCWKYLCDAGKWARILGYVDGDSFIDRRNPAPIVNVHYYEGAGSPDWSIDHGPLPGLPVFPQMIMPEPDIDWPRLIACGYEARQCHLEVWAEKTTMNDELLPICQREQVNLITGAGELSMPAVNHFLRRVRDSGRPAVILYISDFDPAGMGMPISIARKIEFAQYNRREFADLYIALRPIILTADQVRQYSLPRNKIKDTDRRKDTWEALHGEGAVELDALEALMPGVFGNIVTQAIARYRDGGLSYRVRQAENEFQDYLDQLTEDAAPALAEERAALEAEYGLLYGNLNQLRDDLDEALEPYRVRLIEYRNSFSRLAEQVVELRERMAETLEAAVEDIDTTGYEVPQPNLPADNGVLYMTGRKYLDQISYYKTYRETGQLLGGACPILTR